MGGKYDVSADQGVCEGAHAWTSDLGGGGTGAGPLVWCQQAVSQCWDVLQTPDTHLLSHSAMLLHYNREHPVPLCSDWMQNIKWRNDMMTKSAWALINVLIETIDNWPPTQHWQ